MDEVELGPERTIAFNLVEIIEMWNFCMKNKLNATNEIAERLEIEKSDVFCIMDYYLGKDPSYLENYEKLFDLIKDEQEKLTRKLWKDVDFHKCSGKLIKTLWETIESNQWAIPVDNVTQNQYRQLNFVTFDQFFWDMVYKKLHAEYFGARKKKIYEKIYDIKTLQIQFCHCDLL